MTAGEERRGRRRHLTHEERALWRTVTRSVRPFRAGPASDQIVQEQAPAPAATPSAEQPVTRPAPPSSAAPPLLAPLGRRLKQRVARGRESLDARIDLHGMTQEHAHHALLRFLRNAQAEHAKLVLVITGKGARGDEVYGSERGVLRRVVPQWLQLPEFRAYVLGFDSAHGGHGGEGALYLRVRRRR